MDLPDKVDLINVCSRQVFDEVINFVGWWRLCVEMNFFLSGCDGRYEFACSEIELNQYFVFSCR